MQKLCAGAGIKLSGGKIHRCTAALELGASRPCALLICPSCRSNPEVFRGVRVEMYNHIDRHIAEAKARNPSWPFGEGYNELLEQWRTV